MTLSVQPICIFTSLLVSSCRADIQTYTGCVFALNTIHDYTQQEGSTSASPSVALSGLDPLPWTSAQSRALCQCCNGTLGLPSPAWAADIVLLGSHLLVAPVGSRTERSLLSASGSVTSALDAIHLHFFAPLGLSSAIFHTLFPSSSANFINGKGHFLFWEGFF